MILNIGLKNIRKFDSYVIDVGYNLNIIIGNNAIGKTTLLEAIYFCSTTKSERTNDYRELIKTGEHFGQIRIQTNQKYYDVILSEKGKKLRLNQNNVDKLSAFIGDLKTVLFTPSDLMLITGEKALRRNFFDLQLSLIDKQYLNQLNEFKKLLKKRNEILKSDNVDDTLLEVITAQMVEREEYIMATRSAFITKLNQFLQIEETKFKSGEEVSISYEKSIKEDLLSFYKAKLSFDKLTRMTNYGIHRDDYLFFMNDKLAKSYCSQGQLRSIAIALKIALAKLIQENSKSEVIVLLDDVFSELDITRQKRLVAFLKDKPQSFITTTSLQGIPTELLSQAHVIELKE